MAKKATELIKNQLKRADTAANGKKRALDIMTRLKQLEQIKLPWKSLHQDVADFVLINREDMQQNKQNGKEQGTSIYDGTPLAALQLFVDGIYGYMVSPAIQWFGLVIGDPDLNRDDEVRGWLQDTEKRLYAAFARSNFYEAVRSMIEDGAAMGTGALYAEEDVANSRIEYTSLHPGEYYIAQNKYNRVDTLFRKYKTTARQIVERFGEGAVSENLKRSYESNPYGEVTVLHAVFPRRDRNVSKIDNLNKRWASVWIEVQGNTDSVGHILSESGYSEFPYVVWRYRTTGKEVYGRGPAIDAIVEIKTLNKMSKALIARAQLEAEPPLNIPAHYEGSIEYKPRGRNYYIDPSAQVTPWDMGGSYSVGAEEREQARRSVEKFFRTDFFLALSSSEREMTATEAIGRQAEQAAILGPAIGRMTSEGFSAIIDRTFSIEFEAGRIAPPPEALMRYVTGNGQAGGNGQPIDIQYLGPLVQAQKRHFATAGVQRGLESIIPILEIAPNAVMDTINFDIVVEQLLEASGFPQTAINPQELRAILRQQRAAQMAAQQQADQMTQMTEGIEKMAHADKMTDGGIVSQLEEAI